jgi:heterotetrameric sarcosine oxidase gamma subunit
VADPIGDRHPMPPLTGDGVALLPWQPARVTSVTAWSEASLLGMIADLGLARPVDGRFTVATAGGRAWWVAPRQVLIVADEADRPPVPASADHAVHVETAAHTGFRIEGDGCRRILARLLPLDLSERAFPVDGFATTRGEGVIVRLARRAIEGRDGFDLLVPSNLGRFFAEILADAAAGFGIAVPASLHRGTAAPRLSSREVFGRAH